MTLDDLRARFPHLGFGLYALTPGGPVTLEVYAGEEVWTFNGASEGAVIETAFPPPPPEPSPPPRPDREHFRLRTSVMLELVPEKMSDALMKYHLRGLPKDFVLHHFTAPDAGGIHDHPWGFWSTVLSGGYVEHIYPDSGKPIERHRFPGDRFYVRAETRHRIVDLLNGDCWTVIQPDRRAPDRKNGWWDWRDDRWFFRAWDEPDFHEVRTITPAPARLGSSQEGGR